MALCLLRRSCDEVGMPLTYKSAPGLQGWSRPNVTFGSDVVHLWGTRATSRCLSQLQLGLPHGHSIPGAWQLQLRYVTKVILPDVADPRFFRRTYRASLCWTDPTPGSNTAVPPAGLSLSSLTHTWHPGQSSNSSFRSNSRRCSLASGKLAVSATPTLGCVVVPEYSAEYPLLGRRDHNNEQQWVLGFHLYTDYTAGGCVFQTAP